MKRLSLIGAVVLSLSLSPLAAASACTKHAATSPGSSVHKVLAFFSSDREVDVGNRTGAFLELTGAAP